MERGETFGNWHEVEHITWTRVAWSQHEIWLKPLGQEIENNILMKKIIIETWKLFAKDALMHLESCDIKKKKKKWKGSPLPQMIHYLIYLGRARLYLPTHIILQEGRNL